MSDAARPVSMLAAFLTAIFFSLSAIFANRSIEVVGPVRANLGRLFIALILLAIYAHSFGGGLGGAGRDWLLFSGVIGMGLGDLASFAALPRLGPRLTVLMVQCLAAPVAMLTEWLWLGTTLRTGQIGWGFVILVGVGVALSSSKNDPPEAKVTRAGLTLGFLAAVGQGLGAVISRKGNALALLAGEPIDGITAAYQRIVGGFFLTLLYFAIASLLPKKTPAVMAPPPAEKEAKPKPPTWRSYLWIPANALAGAVFGVSCYQWSLATTPSGIVLPIVATTPLVIIPLSYLFEDKEPTSRSLIGGIIAVAGVVALTVTRS